MTKKTGEEEVREKENNMREFGSLSSNEGKEGVIKN